MNRTLAIAFAAAAAAALCAACSHHPAPAATQASAQPAAATPAPQTGEDAQQAYQACLANTAAEVDNSRDSLAALTETVASHPAGRNYETFPVNAYEAEARRLSRFEPYGHTPNSYWPPQESANPDYPHTLDLRRPA